MSKTIAPLLSFGAGGAIAKTAVYSSWKGIPYVRRYVVPANPQTNRQTATRDLFKLLNTMWLYLPPNAKAPWLANAVGRPYTGLNKFLGFNIDGLDTVTPPTNLDGFRASPGALGGLPPVSLALTPGDDQIAAALTAPALPDGWTIEEASYVAFPNQDPADAFSAEVWGMTDASSPYSVTFTGLQSAVEYVVGAWFVWNRPDGKLAYSTGLTDVATTT